MSLTHFTQYAKDLMDDLFPVPPTVLMGRMEAPPRVDSSMRALVGTAFDYAMRLWLEKLNKGKSVTSPLIAEYAIEWADSRESRACRGSFLESYQEDKEGYFLGVLTLESLLPACVVLANMDAVYRQGQNRSDNLLFCVEDAVVRDLEGLVAVLDPEEFRAKERMLLNPTFSAGELVGGADADIIMDDLLIDIKTVKDLSITPEAWRQIIGYAILDQIGAGADDDSYGISRVGIYFSRYGVLWATEVPEISDSAWGRIATAIARYGDHIG